MSSLLFGNGTDIVHWKSSPNTRGTFDILSTCVITMLLCVWTAVHLNVPPPGSVWKPRFRKVGWLILALLAPEMVAYTAWHQRQQAVSLMHTVNRAYGSSNPPYWYRKTLDGVKKAVYWSRRGFVSIQKAPARQPTLESQKSSTYAERHPWTLAHGFYAIMGGFAFELPENLPESKRFLFHCTKETWFVSSTRISLLVAKEAGRSILPNLSEEEIKSKSRANALAKTLVCIQALWFIAQCITRLAQRIPISLLELNTFGHAVCALLIYLLWWEKPFEVDYPTLIEDQSLWDILAQQRHLSPYWSSAAERHNRDFKACLEGDQWVQTLSKEKQDALMPRVVDIQIQLDNILNYDQVDGHYINEFTQETAINDDGEVSANIPAPVQTSYRTVFKAAADLRSLVAERAEDLLESFDSYGGAHSTLPELGIFTEDITRYRMARRAEDVFGVSGIARTLTRRCKDWPEIDDILKLPIAIGFTTVALVYGGLHALAWFAHFDSPTEQLLWRISACVVMGGLPTVLAIIKASDHLEDRSHNYNSDIVLEYAALFVLFAYTLSRAYLVVECFINLSHLPAEAYNVPQWATYFPHIS